MPQTGAKSANFGFLLAHDPLLDHLGALAERYFADDPSTCLMKLRQFGEVRLRSDGQIAEGLRSAINSAIRRGEVIRHDSRYISRAPRGAQATPARATQGRA